MGELTRQFDVNVFGAVATIKAELPFMRQRRAGRIINVTSMGGYITMPGIAYYRGSKFALEGISEVLAKEVSGLGIKLTALAPRSFRTGLGRTLHGPQRTHRCRLRRGVRPRPPSARGKRAVSKRATRPGPRRGSCNSSPWTIRRPTCS